MTLYEGVFIPEGNPRFSLETPLTGNGAKDRQTLIAAARKLFPTGGLRLASTRIFTRAEEAPASVPKGTCVGQLFGESGSETETGLEIGSVFWSGEKSQIFLVNLRSRNAVVLNLRPPGGGKVAFSNQIQANTPAENLKSIVREILGQDIRELEITLRVEK